MKHTLWCVKASLVKQNINKDNSHAICEAKRKQSRKAAVTLHGRGHSCPHLGSSALGKHTNGFISFKIDQFENPLHNRRESSPCMLQSYSKHTAKLAKDLSLHLAIPVLTHLAHSG